MEVKYFYPILLFLAKAYVSFRKTLEGGKGMDPLPAWKNPNSYKLLPFCFCLDLGSAVNT